MTTGMEDSRRRTTASELGPLFRGTFPDRRLILVSNREPYEHEWSEDGEITVKRPAGGLTSALDPVLQAVGGVWIAWGSGEADREVVDGRDRVRVPPESGRYVLRRIWLDQHDVHRYYLGYCNQFLWPLCHLRPMLSRVRRRNWERYVAVNERFARAVLEEAGEDAACVWFQDYHLALAPAAVRARRPDFTLAHFWHIPWPPLEIFRIAPQARELIRGLLANDLLGFHLPSFARNFLLCAEALAGAEVDLEAGTATLGGHTCHVRAYPISIDVEEYERSAFRPGGDRQVERIRGRYLPAGGQLGLGVDRVDYSKGIPERLEALGLLWERWPEYRERFTFLQVAVPSRTDINEYDELNHEMERLAWEVNDRYGTERWQPVHLIKELLPIDRLTTLYRAADVCIVSSLQDGMNLVAKEYVACQRGGTGVLVLSSFAGAAHELRDAVLVNPYDPEGFAERIAEALAMPIPERRERMERMRRGMDTIYDWLAELFVGWGEAAGTRVH